MRFHITHQEEYSRLELILRTLFGYFYIVLPHMFILLFLGLWSAILTFIAFWAILFTGRYPESFYEFQVKLIRWQTRVNARMYNLADEYPAFGLNAEDSHVDVQVAYPESLGRGLAIIKVLFGGLYVGIPHGFLLFFRGLWSFILMIAAWFVVLFTGKYPESMHEFIVGTMRWSTRVNLYLSLMVDDYPPFSASPDPDHDALGGGSSEPPAAEPPAASAPPPPPPAPEPEPAPAPEPEPSPEPPAEPESSDSGGEDEGAEEGGEEDKKEE